MSDSLTSKALKTIQLPIVFTPAAWRSAVLLKRSGHPETLQIDRLSNVLRAAFKAHLTYPHESYVVFEVIRIAPTGHPHHDPLLQLSLNLLQEPDQPSALLIALVGEHQR